MIVRSWSRRIVSDVASAIAIITAFAGLAAAFEVLRVLELIDAVNVAALHRLLPAVALILVLIAAARRTATFRQRNWLPRYAGLEFAAAWAITTCVADPMLVLRIGPYAVAVSLLTAVAFAALAIAAIRACLSHPTLSRHLRRNVAVFGASEDGNLVCEAILRSDTERLVGLFDDRSGAGRHASVSVRVEGNAAYLEALIAEGVVDEVVIALPQSAGVRIQALARRMYKFPIDVWACLGAVEHCPPVVAPSAAKAIAGARVVLVQSKPIRDWGMLLKAVFDRSVAAVMLVALAPVFAAIAVAIKRDSNGPVFFRQRRHGVGGQEFLVWKFRTMTVLEDGATIRQASANDQRVTRVGRFLRRTSLDELPQLLNVLAGDMSLVGPRPHAVAHNREYAQLIETYDARARVRPGMTGWAQVNGFRGECRSPDVMAARVEHDLWYISHWSVVLDLKVLLMTPIYGLGHKNAY